MRTLSNFNLSYFFLFMSPFLSTCMTPDFGDNNDAGYVECTDDFCQTWCEGNYCRHDAGLSAWGACLGACAEEKSGCACQDIGCDSVNCNNWCISEKGAAGGICVKFECLCDFEPDPDLDSGSDSGLGSDSGSD
jgi:hypothetical protein